MLDVISVAGPTGGISMADIDFPGVGTVDEAPGPPGSLSGRGGDPVPGSGDGRGLPPRTAQGVQNLGTEPVADPDSDDAIDREVSRIRAQRIQERDARRAQEERATVATGAAPQGPSDQLGPRVDALENFLRMRYGYQG